MKRYVTFYSLFASCAFFRFGEWRPGNFSLKSSGTVLFQDIRAAIISPLNFNLNAVLCQVRPAPGTGARLWEKLHKSSVFRFVILFFPLCDT